MLAQRVKTRDNNGEQAIIGIRQKVAMAKECKQIYLLPLYVSPAFSHVRLDMKMRIE